jgi:hypothetical protein
MCVDQHQLRGKLDQVARGPPAAFRGHVCVDAYPRGPGDRDRTFHVSLPLAPTGLADWQHAAPRTCGASPDQVMRPAAFVTQPGRGRPPQVLLRLMEEDHLIAEATGNPPVALAVMMIETWRGREHEASELIEAISQASAASGLGLMVDYCVYVCSVLYNGLGRHDAARDAAQRAFERKPVGYGPLVVSELAEAAARTGDVELVRAALEWVSERARVTPTEWALGIHQARHQLPQPAPPGPARRPAHRVIVIGQ